ncbi:MAG: HD-GYP domain-containing protein [Fervidobacterium sp.]
MLSNEFRESFKNAFGKYPEEINSDTTIIRTEGKIVIKKDDKVLAEFEDEESDYGFILKYFARKAGLITPPDKEIEDLLRSLFANIIVLTEVEDKNGFSHSQRVAKIAEEFAKYLGWSDEQALELRHHGILHDVGKIAIEQLMLYSPTRLRSLETHYEDHPIMGTIYLSINENLWKYIPTARHHHERWDGKGFPDKLKEEEIPICARIISIIDYYDEVTNFVSADWDSELKTPKQALEEIQKMNGTYFDPELSEKFVAFMSEKYNIN